MRYEQQAELDAKEDLNGDRSFVRVRSRVDAAELRGGELADAFNVRLDRADARTRGGMSKVAGNPLLSNDAPLVVPFTVGPSVVVRTVYDDGIFCTCVYNWPAQASKPYLCLFAKQKCYVFHPESEDLDEIDYDSGETLAAADGGSAVAANGKVYLFRGASKTVLEWDGNAANTFDPVTSGAHPSGGTYIRMPNAAWGVWAHKRMVLPYSAGGSVVSGYELILSDIGDVDTYDTQYRQFRIRYGAHDELVGAAGYRDDQLIVGFRRSMHLITNLSTLSASSLGEVEVHEITQEAGLLARRSLLVIGDRVFWIASGGVYGLFITDDLKLKGIGKPLNWDIDWFDEVNWDAIDTAYSIAERENRVGFVVPTGGADRPTEIFWYSLLNEGWECRDTFPNGFRIDYVMEAAHGGVDRLFAVSRAGGVYLLNDEAQDYDEYGGTSAVAEVGTYDIAGRIVTREYRMHEPNASVWMRGQVTAELAEGDSLTVTAQTRDPDYTKQVATISGAADRVMDPVRFPMRVRGAGVQLDIESTGGAFVLRQCNVVARERGRLRK